MVFCYYAHSADMDLWTRLWGRYHVPQNVFLVIYNSVVDSGRTKTKLWTRHRGASRSTAHGARVRYLMSYMGRFKTLLSLMDNHPLALSFPGPQPDSQGKGSCFCYTGYMTPIPWQCVILELPGNSKITHDRTIPSLEPHQQITIKHR